MLRLFILPLLFLPSVIISQTPLPPQGFSFDASIPQPEKYPIRLLFGTQKKSMTS